MILHAVSNQVFGDKQVITISCLALTCCYIVPLPTHIIVCRHFYQEVCQFGRLTVLFLRTKDTILRSL